jgi:serine/threonine protein kinase
MTFDELARRIQDATGVDAKALHDVFRERGEAADLAGFVAFLHHEGVLPEELRAELIAALAGRQDARPSKGPQANGGDSSARYERLGLLGAGAMGDVFEAHDPALRRKVALKSMKGRPTPRQRDMFLKEVRITAQLDHPGIVPVYSLDGGPARSDGADPGDGRDVAYAMKLVRGKELARLLEEARRALDAGGPRAPEHTRDRLIEHLRRVCEAVAFAHARGVVHRDLKPANIMIGRFGEVYLMDWGIARVRASAEELDPGVPDLGTTRAGSIMGTPLYMAPEQADGRTDAVDGRSDLFALGLMLQEILTLRPPRGGTTVEDLLGRARRGERAELASYPGDAAISREARGIVARATHPDPAQRYADVEAFAEDLRRLLAGEEVRAAPDDGWQRAARTLARHRRGALVALVVLVLATAASVVTATAVVHEKRVLTQAHAREDALEGLVADATRDAEQLDAELLRLELALERASGAAIALLATAPSDAAPDAIRGLLMPTLERAHADTARRKDGPALQLAAERTRVVLRSGVRLSFPADASTPDADTPGNLPDPAWEVVRSTDGSERFSCIAPLRETRGMSLGTIALDVPLDAVRAFLQRDGAAWTEARLFDAAGHLQMRGRAADSAPPSPAVAAAVREGRRGLVELGDRHLAIVPIGATGGALVAHLVQLPAF